MSRDEFSPAVKQRLAARAGYKCSNSECRAPTSGPQLEEEKAVNVGVAAHLSGAAPGGARYNPAFTRLVRSSIKNGIWLCQTCSKLIDNDEHRYPTEILHLWKLRAEQEAHRQIGKAKSRSQPSNAERALKRDLKLRDRMHKDFLKSEDTMTLERSRTAGNVVRHPYEKFRQTEAIIHRIDDVSYPEHDNSPGMSSWFKVEFFDFYHGGIKVILDIKSGVIEDGSSFVSNRSWAIIPHDADFDHSRFTRIGIWKLGLIPFRNIRHYDLAGDEYYPFPHLYCTFTTNGAPYEGFEYAVVGKDEYDWPLNPELQVSE